MLARDTITAQSFDSGKIVCLTFMNTPKKSKQFSNVRVFSPTISATSRAERCARRTSRRHRTSRPNLELGEEFLSLRRAGWQIKTTENKIAAPAVLAKYPAIRTSPLGIAKVAWQMTILEPTAYLAELRRRDDVFLRGRNQKSRRIFRTA